MYIYCSYSTVHDAVQLLPLLYVFIQENIIKHMFLCIVTIVLYPFYNGMAVGLQVLVAFEVHCKRHMYCL